MVGQEMSDKVRRKNSQKGVTLIELLIVVNIVAVLTGLGSITVSEYSHESRCLDCYSRDSGAKRDRNPVENLRQDPASGSSL